MVVWKCLVQHRKIPIKNTQIKAFDTIKTISYAFYESSVVVHNRKQFKVGTLLQVAKVGIHVQFVHHTLSRKLPQKTWKMCGDKICFKKSLCLVILLVKYTLSW